jgi:1,4-alpha-glucan branching enzyme
MPGDDWQKFANLRLLFGYMYGQPGKKLLFMGGEFGQWKEWVHDESLEWHLLDYPLHAGVQKWVSDLNAVYAREPALHELDCNPAGFEWIDCTDADSSVFSWLRKAKSSEDLFLVACNFTPVPRSNYRIGAPRGGYWQEILNSDAGLYGGSNLGNGGGLEVIASPAHNRPYSLNLTLPPLAMVFLKNEKGAS